MVRIGRAIVVGAAMMILGAGMARPAAAQGCTGDCSGDGEVTVTDLIKMVNISLETAPLEGCTAGDANTDGAITVNEIHAHYRRTYRAQGTILGVAGRFDWDELKDTVGEALGHWEAGDGIPLDESVADPRPFCLSATRCRHSKGRGDCSLTAFYVLPWQGLIRKSDYELHNPCRGSYRREKDGYRSRFKSAVGLQNLWRVAPPNISGALQRSR